MPEGARYVNPPRRAAAKRGTAAAVTPRPRQVVGGTTYGTVKNAVAIEDEGVRRPILTVAGPHPRDLAGDRRERFMVLATVPGYPRIGKQRELKKALEAYWAGNSSRDALAAAAAAIRRANWQAQQAAGLDLIPVNDFSLYDQVLDTACLVGAVPPRYGRSGDEVDVDTMFAMARGTAGEGGVRAMEMTKWFDTNYHYIVPELGPETTFRLASDKPFAELAEAMAAGLGEAAKPVLLGPLSFLLLAKPTVEGFAPLDLLDRLLPVYAETIGRLAANGATWVQIDEPVLVMDRTADELGRLERTYVELGMAKGSAKLLLQTAYGHVGEAYPLLRVLPVDALGLDLVRGSDNLQLIERYGPPPPHCRIVAGVVDGRNVWINDLAASLTTLRYLTETVPVSQLVISASCSLQHVPYDVALEIALDPEVRSWLAFAEQKLAEIALLKRALNGGEAAVARALDANRETLAQAAASPRRRNTTVRERLAALPPEAARRSAPYAERRAMQHARLELPRLPTTTIGSFPQTGEVRAVRRRFERGEITGGEYEGFVEDHIRALIAEQEQLGLDVLVHGEFERNDMVQYFGERLEGFAFTHHGWVQSYGSRYVRPPIVFGDVARPHPMSVRWTTFAQGLTERPVKGMLTGPVTILNWSFVRDDQPRAETCRQIALAMRDEVADLEAAGIRVIQVDEPALREGLPLRRSEWAHYLGWAVDCFRLATGVVRPETQIHTHMCYSQFGDVMDAIAALDADVLSIENARSGQTLLEAFRQHGYDKEVGPGVYDIHSPRVPPAEEMAAGLRATLTVLDPAQVWVNPDCGLKTRRPEEVHAALTNMVAAARTVRESLAEGSA